MLLVFLPLAFLKLKKRLIDNWSLIFPTIDQGDFSKCSFLIHTNTDLIKQIWFWPLCDKYSSLSMLCLIFSFEVNLFSHEADFSAKAVSGFELF